LPTNDRAITQPSGWRRFAPTISAGYIVRRLKFDPAASGLAVNADTDFHFSLGEIEGWRAGGRNRTARERETDGARSLTRSPKTPNIKLAPFLIRDISRPAVQC
jgi:hypothetical protein